MSRLKTKQYLQWQKLLYKIQHWTFIQWILGGDTECIYHQEGTTNFENKGENKKNKNYKNFFIFYLMNSGSRLYKNHKFLY